MSKAKGIPEQWRLDALGRQTKKNSQITPAIPSPAPASHYFDIKGAAQYLSTTIFAMREAVRCRKVSAKKIGKRYIFERAELDRFFTSLEPVQF
jgi:hypothetical protein